MSIKSLVYRSLVYGLYTVSFVFVAYFPIRGIPDIIHTVSPKIQTKEQVYNVLYSEKENFEITDEITLRFFDGNSILLKRGVAGYVDLNPSDDGYVIGLDKSNVSKIAIRHELCHIKTGDVKMYAGNSVEEDLQKRQERSLSFNRVNTEFLEARARLCSLLPFLFR